jgi:hypothetical protein
MGYFFVWVLLVNAFSDFTERKLSILVLVVIIYFLDNGMVILNPALALKKRVTATYNHQEYRYLTGGQKNRRTDETKTHKKNT